MNVRGPQRRMFVAIGDAKRGTGVAAALLSAAALALLSGCGGSSSSSAASATPDRSNYQGPGEDGSEYVDVEPNSNLTDGQTVMVSGFGFKPNISLAFNMCKLVTRGYSDCDPTTTRNNSVKSDASGTFPATAYKVSQHVAFPSSRNVMMDCGTTVCAIGVGDVGGTTSGSHCVGFGGPCQPAPGNKPASASGQPSAQLAVLFGAGFAGFGLRRRRRARD